MSDDFDRDPHHSPRSHDSSPDADLQRLSAADPAGEEPDLTAVRARVLAAAVDESAAAHPVRSRTSPRVIAGGIAAAVALLAAGTLAGVAVGRATADDPILALSEDTGDVPSVNSAPEIPSVGAGPLSGSAATGGPEATAADERASSMIWPGYSDGFQPVPGLVDTPGAAVAYRLDGQSIDRAALATQLASVFDVTGRPSVDRDGMVNIGTDNGPMIWVYDDATISWSFTDSSRDPWGCPDEAIPEPASTGMSEPGIAGPCTPTAEPISEGAAREQAEAILSALGVVDAPGLAVGVDWETFSDGAVTTATAWQTLDGARTQLNWSISFDSLGPLWANGFAAGLVSVGELPVVGARTAVLRSAEPRWRPFGPTPIDPMVMPMVREGSDPETPDSSQGNQDEVVTDPVTPSAANDISIFWDPVIVTDAEPTITQYWNSTGEFWLLPGYRLATADDRGDWVVIAVAEVAVTFTAGD